MWKPSKRLVTRILVILLIYNIFTLIATYVSPRPVYATPPLAPTYFSSGDNLYVRNVNAQWTAQEEASWWHDEMNKIDNNLQMILSFPRNWGLSKSDEIWGYEFKLSRIGGTLLVSTDSPAYQYIQTPSEGSVLVSTGNTIDVGEHKFFFTSDWLKNLLVPWTRDIYRTDFWNDGSFRNLFVVESLYRYGDVENLNIYLKWENLDFVVIGTLRNAYGSEYSLWGPIHFLIVLGALVYVEKRWN